LFWINTLKVEKNKNKYKALETILVLVGAMIILYLSYHKKIFLLIALLLIGIAIVSDPITLIISRGWLKLAELMGIVMSKVMLTIIYFVFLFPIALLYRLSGKDPLQLSKKKDSYYSVRDKLYDPKDIENIW
jgi:hypothetical protein